MKPVFGIFSSKCKLHEGSHGDCSQQIPNISSSPNAKNKSEHWFKMKSFAQLISNSPKLLYGKVESIRSLIYFTI